MSPRHFAMAATLIGAALGLFAVNLMAVISYPQLFSFECPAAINDHLYWGMLLLARTGSVHHNIYLVSLARGRGLPGNSLQHATSIWLAIATLRLHTLGASFTLDRFVQAAQQRHHAQPPGDEQIQRMVVVMARHHGGVGHSEGAGAAHVVEDDLACHR